MYCAQCGNQLTPGLSYCNRCGANLRERIESHGSGTMTAFLTAITVIAVAGLSLMLGGALALKTGGDFGGEIIGPFMIMTFLLLLVVEIFLCRQLARVTSNRDKALPAPITTPPAELHAAQQRALREPLASVTENTTRTLEYAKNETSHR